MASIDEELLMDEEENRREIAFIRERLPLDAKEKYDDELLLWMLDTLVEYYVSSGLLDGSDDEADIDMEAVASYVCEQAKLEKKGKLDQQEVFFVVEADLDFQEQNI
jgi:hypothetical protein